MEGEQCIHPQVAYDTSEDTSVAVDGEDQPSLAGFMKYISDGVSSGIRRVRDFMQPVLG